MNARISRPIGAAALTLVLGACALRAADATGENVKKVNINQATAAQLSHLPRVGAKAAQRIVDFRTSKGPFARIEDLMEVKGFGEKRFEQLKPYLSVSGPTTLEAKVSSAGSRGGRVKSAKTGKKSSAAKTAAASLVPVGQGR